MQNACKTPTGTRYVATVMHDMQISLLTELAQVKLDPKKAQPKHPKWVWAHDPEKHVYENYGKHLCRKKRTTG